MKKVILLTAAVALAGVILVDGAAWVGGHDRVPRRPISADTKPMSVQVVSLDWKWLFIYPDEGVATVNELTIPVGRPVHFDLTSSGAMNGFSVPQLGGGGRSVMNVAVSAVSAEQFAQWVATVKKAGPVLDAAAYTDLSTPSAEVPPFRFRAVAPNMFDAISKAGPQRRL